MTMADLDQATIARWPSPRQATLLDPRDMERWGWYMALDEEAELDIAIEAAVEKIGASKDPDDWVFFDADHRFDWNTDGRSGKATDARYRTGFNRKKDIRVMVVDSLYSPQFQNAQQNLNTALPDLQRCSDIAYLQYYGAIMDKNIWSNEFQIPSPDANGRYPLRVAVPPLQYIIFPGIADTGDTIAVPIIKRIYQEAIGMNVDDFTAAGVKDATAWPGKIFVTLSDSKGLAFMGTEHAKAVTFFLAQHKELFTPSGAQYEVKSVQVWAFHGGWNAMLEIGQVQSASDVNDEIV
ncbi:hypothetical protein EJ08DRAFT_133996 [Tothia fuscella]|uniref:Uncharacterized protein n=1 Tax=Tothia fuscella TaxID=1048955 RepID=A0A9P4NVM7_9PEZI|nr:hypothetical protein EJ08DRAFT_133996 [Tothia fuscella]